MARVRTSASQSRVFTLVLVIAVVAVLYLAKEVLIPLALAVLLSFMLAPLVTQLERRRVPRVPAVVLVVTFTFIVVGVVGYVIATQLVDLAGNVGEYNTRLSNRVNALTNPETGPFSGLQSAIRQFNEKLADPRGKSAAKKAPAKPGPDPEEPVQVVLTGNTASSFSYLTVLLTPVMGALVTTGIVIVFTFFMLIGREDLRNRVIRLIGPNQLTLTTQVLDDAARRVSRYLLMQLIVNGSYGLALTLGLFLIGIPNAALWGFLAALLRYIPYVGPWVAAIFPMTLSLVAFADATWSTPLMTAGLFIALELVSNNFLEPILYGSSTGVSTIGILLAAVFWTWLWGPIGLVLATPITVCIVVLGRHFPQLEFFDVLLSDEPSLEPGANFYQRLLAGDQTEANKIIEKQLEDKSLLEFYDEVLLPALGLVEQDKHRGVLDEGKLEFVHESIRELIEDLEDRELTPDAPAEPSGHPSDAVAQQVSSQHCIMCLPARDEADELAAIMLAQLLTKRGSCAHAASHRSLASELLDQVAEQNVNIVCVSAVPPFAATHAKYLCKRLRARFPEIKLVIGLWQTNESGKKSEVLLTSSGADRIFTRLTQALEQI